MPDLLTVGPDWIIDVRRDVITHTYRGERCVGGPFETLFVTFHGCRNVQIDIRKSAIGKDGIPACVPGLIMLRDELSNIIAEYSTRKSAAVSAFARRVASTTKHGPGGMGGEGPCDPDCIKCAAEGFLR